MPGSINADNLLQKFASQGNLLLTFFWLSDMNGLTRIVLAFAFCGSLAQAEPVTLTLSQEQDGGDAGRACMYIHQGKAEYRLVQPEQSCPATLIVEASGSKT